MIPECSLYGNCLLGALYLKACLGGRLKGLRLREGGPRHWIVKTPTGDTWHFRRQRDILPRMLRNLVFIGRFEKLEPRNKAVSHAHE